MPRLSPVWGEWRADRHRVRDVELPAGQDGSGSSSDVGMLLNQERADGAERAFVTRALAQWVVAR